MPTTDAPRRERIIQVLLASLPTLAVLGPWAWIRPGAAGAPYAYRVVGVLAVVPAVVIAWRGLRRSRMVQAFTLFCALALPWAAVTLLWSPARATGVREIFAIGSAAGLAWVTFALTGGRTSRVRWLARGWWIALGLTLVVCAVEVFAGRHLLSIIEQSDWRYRFALAAGTFSNPNNLACFLVLAFALVVNAMLRQGRAGVRVLLGVLLVILALLLVATNSRGGQLGAVLVVVFAAVHMLRQRHGMGHSGVVATALSGIIAAGVLLLVPSQALAWLDRGANPGSWYLPWELPGQLPTATPTAVPGGDIDKVQAAESDQLRITLLKKGWQYFTERPVQGHGAGSFMTLLQNDPTYAGQRIINAHNLVMQWAVHYGIIGLVPLVLLGVALVWGLVREVRRPAGWTIPLFGALVALGLYMVLASDATGEAPLWAILAFAAAIIWQDERFAHRGGGSTAAAPGEQAEEAGSDGEEEPVRL